MTPQRICNQTSKSWLFLDKSNLALKPKLIVIFLLIVLIPLGLLLWLGVRVSNYEKESIQKKYQGVTAKTVIRYR